MLREKIYRNIILYDQKGCKSLNFHYSKDMFGMAIYNGESKKRDSLLSCCRFWFNIFRNTPWVVFYQPYIFGHCLFWSVAMATKRKHGLNPSKVILFFVTLQENVENSYIFCYQPNRLSDWDYVDVYFILACTNNTAFLSPYKCDSDF